MTFSQLTITDFTSLQDYAPTWQAMQDFSQQTDTDQTDQLWLMEHQPVFTQGRAGKAEHVLNPNNIQVVQTDRGGQVTYHGPGQLMIYTLLHVERLKLNSRELVRRLEQVIIDTLNTFGISSANNPTAPGVYVDQAKIASIGLRITRGVCYHGMALNVDMDMTPFQWINPCGYKGQLMTMIRDFYPTVTMLDVKQRIISAFLQHFDYPLEHITRYNHAT